MTTNLQPRSMRVRRGAAVGTVLLFSIPLAVQSTRQLTRTMSAVAETAAETMQQIEIRTKDYAFDMPLEFKAGLLQVSLVNEGKEMHHVWMVKLEEGKTLSDLFAYMKTGPKTFPKWAVNYGGPNAPAPGAKAVAILDLGPGHYAVLCVIPSPDGTPHVMKGMAKEFDVVGPRVVAEMPKVDIEAELRDYDFVFSKPLQTGRNVIRFTNNATQPHEAFIAKLAPGKKAADLLGWIMKPDGPPPGMPMGGITGIESGQSITIVQDLEPGTYAFYCFVPDAKDGREHIAHGMIREFTVAAR